MKAPKNIISSLEVADVLPEMSYFHVIRPFNADMKPWAFLEFSRRTRELGQDAVFAAMDGIWNSSAPLALKIMKGNTFGDVVGNTGGSVIVSSRMMRILCDHMKHDLKADRVQVYTTSDDEPVDTELWWVRPRVGINTLHDSGYFLILSSERRHDHELKDAVGISFDTSQWNGDHVFIPGGIKNMLFVTEPVAKSIKEARLGGFESSAAPTFGTEFRDSIVKMRMQRKVT